MTAIRKAAVWLMRLTSIVGITLGVVTFLPVLEPWISWLRSPWPEQGGEVLIILSGESNVGDVLGLHSYWRTFYAVEEWRAGHYRTVVFSGGGGIAEAMRNFAVANGIPSIAILLETRSSSTRENALFCAQLLHDVPGTRILLTSDFHSGRAYRAFLKAGVTVTPRPIPDAGKRANSRLLRWEVFLDLMEETAKTIWYRLHGWT